MTQSRGELCLAIILVALVSLATARTPTAPALCPTPSPATCPIKSTGADHQLHVSRPGRFRHRRPHASHRIVCALFDAGALTLIDDEIFAGSFQ